MTTKTRVTLGAFTCIVAIVAVVVVALGPARDREVSNLGVDVFDLNAPSVAAQIAENGPFFFPDPLNRDRPIWVQHEGAAIEAGWSVFAGVSRDDCLVDHDFDTDEFVDCDGQRFPSDGEGLFQYPVEVDGSVLSIDLNFADRPETETETEETE